jgi:hypothetical protein
MTQLAEPRSSQYQYWAAAKAGSATRDLRSGTLVLARVGSPPRLPDGRRSGRARYCAATMRWEGDGTGTHRLGVGPRFRRYVPLPLFLSLSFLVTTTITLGLRLSRELYSHPSIHRQIPRNRSS